jgi:ribosomal protein L6P/L9E
MVKMFSAIVGVFTNKIREYKKSNPADGRVAFKQGRKISRKVFGV